MSTDPKFDELAQDLVDRNVIRVRIAPGIRPRDGQKAYLVRGGKYAGLITTAKTGVFLGTLDGCKFWGVVYQFVFLRPVGGKALFCPREISVAEACELLGVNPTTFSSKCSRSKGKAWPLIKGIYRQASVAEPYPHFYAYRVDPRGQWRVTMFARSQVVQGAKLPIVKESNPEKVRELARKLMDEARSGR